MQKIVLFIEPQEDQSITPLKIGNLFINRFSIEEDECNEILKIYYLDNKYLLYWDYHFDELTKTEGPDSNNIIIKFGNLTWKQNKVGNTVITW